MVLTTRYETPYHRVWLRFMRNPGRDGSDKHEAQGNYHENSLFAHHFSFTQPGQSDPLQSELTDTELQQKFQPVAAITES